MSKMMIKMMKTMLNTSMILTTFMLMNMKKKIKYMNTLNSIECGFNNMLNKNKPMNINFISIMLIFIIFDLEVSLMIPMITMMKKHKMIMNIKSMMILMMFMILSMMYEIKNKSIKWK